MDIPKINNINVPKLPPPTKILLLLLLLMMMMVVVAIVVIQGFISNMILCIYHCPCVPRHCVRWLTCAWTNCWHNFTNDRRKLSLYTVLWVWICHFRVREILHLVFAKSSLIFGIFKSISYLHITVGIDESNLPCFLSIFWFVIPEFL